MINTALEKQSSMPSAQTGAAVGMGTPLSPTPVVLVAGDFRSRDTFVWHAWERICAAYKDSDDVTSFSPMGAWTIGHGSRSDGERRNRVLPLASRIRALRLRLRCLHRNQPSVAIGSRYTAIWFD